MDRQPLSSSEKSQAHKTLESFRQGEKYSVGIDIGSISSDVVVLDSENNIVFSDYSRTTGGPIKTVRRQLRQVLDIVDGDNLRSVAATGSVGRFLAKLLDIPFVNEVPAQAAAIRLLYPHFKRMSIIEMGGQDSKLIHLAPQQGQVHIEDFALNTGCAAGTGSFLDQQADRLGINIEEEFGRLALESNNVPRMAGRCSVFAKTDMIHLQQQATPTCDIIAGLCQALARNLKSNLGQGRKFIKPIVFTGGVAANIGVVRAMETVFQLEKDELVVPSPHFFTGAIGAVKIAASRPESKKPQLNIQKIDEYLSSRGSALERAPRREKLARPSLPPPKSIVHDELLEQADKPIDAYLGVDVGSISTNVVVMDPAKRVLAKAYLMTAGKPLEAVRKGLDIVNEKVRGKVNILGAATTGSGRYLTGDFIGADVVINEITAQATGTAIVNPEVDTIFEIGGQDSKYISLANGVVVDFEMNHACAAGTGSFLEEQAQRLGININEEFAELAFQSDAPIKLGERCTVFMESDLLGYQQQGAKTKELVAGLSYSIVANYLNRVVGRRKIGDNICFQGGTAFNKAVLSAFENVTGKQVMVPDHHEVTGALGAASIAAEYMQNKAREQKETPTSSFRGFQNVAAVDYTVESFTCQHCANHCEIKKVHIPGSEPLYYGSRCDRYNLKKREAKSPGLGAIQYRNRKMLAYAGLTKGEIRQTNSPATIGIPWGLITWQLLPMFSRFFSELGFDVVLSGKTNKATVRHGVESVTAQTCFPVKVAYGHVAELIEKKVDYIFIPSIVSMIDEYPENAHNQLCPYIQSLAYQVRTAFASQLGETSILSEPLRLGEGKKLLTKSFVSLALKVGVKGRRVRRAINTAIKAQDDFKHDIEQKGREIIDSIKNDEKLFVLISRPYNGCDDGVNMQLPKKLADLGVKLIPMDMLDLNQAPLTSERLHRKVYWTYGQKILRAAEVIKRDKRLFGIYLSNFSCGPDSFLMTFFKNIMGEKPCLQLEIDEHSAAAGVITRLEAFLDSLKHHSADIDSAAPQSPGAVSCLSKERTLFIPYMGDGSHGVASCLRRYGQPAEVMPIADEQALINGRKYTTGKECLPCAITTGDILTVLERDDVSPDHAAFFMPGAQGPCRFGMYGSLHELVLSYVGGQSAAIVSPNQDTGFYRHLGESLDGTAGAGFMRDMWIATVGADLLTKTILRIRPYARSSEQARKIYDANLRMWTHEIEAGKNLSQMRNTMEQLADNFDKIELDPQIRKPRVGVVGEIYVRNHPFANMNIIRRLEDLGAACSLASLSEWIYYTNFTRKRMARRRRQWRNLMSNAFQDVVQKKIERKLAEPLEKKFGKLTEEPIKEVLQLSAPYLHDSFEGEAVLTVGKTVEYYKQGFGGVVNVMPFSCMPSTVVSTQEARISADCDSMPILSLSFDGQEDATLDTRLEAFVEQIRERHTGVANIETVLSIAE